MTLQVTASQIDACSTLTARLPHAQQALQQAAITAFVQQSHDLTQALPQVEAFVHDATQLYVLGTGGSALGAQALLQLATTLPNLTPLCKVMVWEALDLPPHTPSTRYLIVSKSGRTLETMAQALQLLQQPLQTGQVMVITDPVDNPLRRMATQHNWPILNHPLNIGGRFAVLSVVGLVPAFCAGLDVAQIRAGAAAADAAQAARSALELLSHEAAGMQAHVLWIYGQAYAGIGAWHRQLWAESLGKNGAGSTLLPAIGSADQHSQLQLWREGANDKTHTFICNDLSGHGAVVPQSTDPDLAYLSGHRTGHLQHVMRASTAQSLQQAGRPVRFITPAPNTTPAHIMGGLLMYFMLKTIAAGALRGIDPYNQPAVEDGKKRAISSLTLGQ